MVAQLLEAHEECIHFSNGSVLLCNASAIEISLCVCKSPIIWVSQGEPRDLGFGQQHKLVHFLGLVMLGVAAGVVDERAVPRKCQ